MKTSRLCKTAKATFTALPKRLIVFSFQHSTFLLIHRILINQPRPVRRLHGQAHSHIR